MSKVEMKRWGWNIAAKSLKSLAPKFNERYPDVNVDVLVSGANLQTRFLLSLAAGTGAPDIMQLQGYETPRYVNTGRLTEAMFHDVFRSVLERMGG